MQQRHGQIKDEGNARRDQRREREASAADGPGKQRGGLAAESPDLHEGGDLHAEVPDEQEREDREDGPADGQAEGRIGGLEWQDGRRGD